MFNLGALHSHAGMTQDRGDMEGLKRALKHFQLSAGMFKYLRDGTNDPKDDEDIGEHASNVASSVGGVLTSDLSCEGLGMLYYLMLAQAQACYYEKAIRDRMNCSILTKLAAQTSEWYRRAKDLSNHPILVSVLDKGWALHLEFQHLSFEASAEFQMARVTHDEAEKTGAGYGEEIARLHNAEVMCTNVINFGASNKIPGSILEACSNLLHAIKTTKAKRVADNDQIYMDVVPSSSNLVKPTKHALAKATPVDQELVQAPMPNSKEEAEDTLFKGLLPPALQEAEVVFQSQLAAMVASQGSVVLEAAEGVRIRLAEAGLPAAVESGSNEGGLPEAVWERIELLVNSKGGAHVAQEECVQNSIAAANVERLLKEVLAKLDEEEMKDRQCRAEFGGEKWIVTPSGEFSKSLRHDVARYRSLLTEARNSGVVVQEKLTGAQGPLSILSKTKPELEFMLPSLLAVESDPRVEELRMKLSLQLVDLGSLVQEVESLQANLVEEAHNDSIMHVMGRGGNNMNKDKIDDLVKTRLENKYENKIISHMKAKIASINPLFAKVLDTNFDFAASRTQNALTQQRETFLSDIDAAIQTFIDIYQHVEDGAKFYVNLAARCETLRATCEDHIFVRNMQREELATQLRSSASSARPTPILRSQNSLYGNDFYGDMDTPPASSFGISHAGSREERDRTQSYVSAVSSVSGNMDLNNFPRKGGVSSVPRSPGRSLDASAAAVPSVSEETNDNADHIATMRSMLGLDSQVTDAQLNAIIEGAGGDINIAVNHFLERGVGDSGDLPVSKVAGEADEAKAKKIVGRKKSGWFR